MRRIAVLVVLGVLAGCSGGEGGGPSGATCPTGGTTLTYENFGKSFMTSYCTRCHSSALSGSARDGAPSGENYDTLAGIQAHTGSIDREAAGGAMRINTAMPEGAPSPTDAERKQLGEWLACGAN